mgnify:CR=1 FL=1
MKSVNELTKLGASFETITIHNKVHTVEDVERACNCAKSEVIKTLLFVGRKPVVVLMTGDKKVDLDKLKKVRDDDSLRMANKVEVGNITGFTVGTVSPFGLREVDVIADKAVQALNSLIMGSGKDDILLKIKGSEFIKSFNGSFISVAL